MYELHLNYIALLRVYSTFEIPHRISLQIYNFFNKKQGGVSEYVILTHRPGDMIWRHRQRGRVPRMSAIIF